MFNEKLQNFSKKQLENKLNIQNLEDEKKLNTLLNNEIKNLKENKNEVNKQL